MMDEANQQITSISIETATDDTGNYVRAVWRGPWSMRLPCRLYGSWMRSRNGALRSLARQLEEYPQLMAYWVDGETNHPDA
jgi:hypothetical protein